MDQALILNPPFFISSRFSLKRRAMLRVFWILAVLAITGLSVLCVLQLVAESSERYLVQKYASQADLLVKDNKNLEINTAQTDSLENILTSITNFNFVKVDKIDYIRVIDNEVVAK